MKINEIKDLIELMNNSNLSALEVQEGAVKIRLEKNSGAIQAATAPVQGEVFTGANEKREEPVPVKTKTESVTEAPAAKVEENYKTIKAPMVGAFHFCPGEPVGPGTKLKKGDRVCIIEAMKLMNEITMEENGEIISVEVKEGVMVEFGQVLVKYK